MNNFFNDLQNQDPFLNFIGNDSSNNQSNLFREEGAVKVEEDEGFIQVAEERQMEEEKAIKRRRREKSQNDKNNSRKKVFYRDKMASLISEQEMQEKVDYNYGDFSQHGRGKSPISRDEQLRRNRESAKHSRQRRKEYVETLQHKNYENQKTIAELESRLADSERERDRLREDNRSYIKEFINSKNQSFDKMKKILQGKTGKGIPEMISEELKLIKAKFGAAGSERVATTDYYIKEIIEILLADVHKYLMHSALSNSGLCGLGGWTSLDDQICDILNVKKDVRVGISKNYRMKMLEEFQSFKDITQRFYDAYRAVQHQAKIIEKIFDNVSLEFNDASIGKLLLWIEENKYQKELRKIRAEWKQTIESPQIREGGARKMSRHERDL